MLDSYLRPLIDPPLNRAGRALSERGVLADQVTLAGLALGLLAAVVIAFGWFGFGLFLILLSRLADGLDGAVARATKRTDFGGYLDISCDFLFYGAIPMAFVWYDPVTNGAAGAFLLVSFYFNGATFLGYAILAEKVGAHTEKQGLKSLYYSNGLLEGSETIGFFVLICLFPGAFPLLSWIFAILCFATAGLRLYGARHAFTS